MAKKNTTAAAVEIPTLQYIELALVKTSALNPRKVFNQNELEELSASISKVGVIQPITVRLHPEGGFELVCGERRYHASILAGLKEVPASVRTLTDAEAMELMVTENLQRKDVHPLEEADAFNYMIDRMGYELVNVGARVGKSDGFVARRIQLTKLIPELKEAFKLEKITIGHAELLCRISDDDQRYWDENVLNSNYSTGPGTVRELKNHLNYRVEKKLSNALFDTTIPCAGTIECTICPANSAFNSSLFPDKAEDAICHNSACFNRKTEAKFLIDLEEAITNPNIYLVKGYSSEDSTVVNKLKADGHLLLKEYDDFRRTSIQVPQAPVRSEFELEDYESLEELETSYAADLAEYHSSFEEYQTIQVEIAAGTSNNKRLFYVTGSDKGKFIYGTINENKISSVSAAESPDAAVTVQITNIESRQRRGYELDKEKLHKRLVDHIKELPIYTKYDDSNILLEPVESALLIVFAYQHCGYQNQKAINELLGFDKNRSFYGSGVELIEAIKKADLAVRTYIVRSALYSHFCGNPAASVGGDIIFELAKHWDEPGYQKMFDEQEAIKIKRDQRAAEKIAALTPGEAKPKWRDLHKVTNDD